MAKLEIRLRAGEAANWDILRRRKMFNGDPSRIRAKEDWAKMAQTAAARGANLIDLPALIALSPKLSIMNCEVSERLFKQVMAGCAIDGHNAQYLQAVFETEPKDEGAPITPINLFDARRFAKRLSTYTGEKYRLPTKEEWEAAEVLLLKDSSNWANRDWTSTSLDSGKTYIACSFSSGWGGDFGDMTNARGSKANTDGTDPNDRYYGYTIRLVREEKNAGVRSAVVLP
jgi:hypothetical protein